LWAPVAPDDLELHLFAILQSFVSFHLDGRIVDENIILALALDETVALAGVEPLDTSFQTHLTSSSRTERSREQERLYIKQSVLSME
jgi:hypothetical protein